MMSVLGYALRLIYFDDVISRSNAPILWLKVNRILGYNTSLYSP